jgi:hypothetical protein
MASALKKNCADAILPKRHIHLGPNLWEQRTNAAVPKAHDMTLKEASYTTEPQAQHMMFNRAKEEEHHGRRRKRLESAWNYLQWNMVTGIGVGRRQFLCHCSRRR